MRKVENMTGLYNEDCISFFSKMEEKSVDLVVTDPPYGINYKTNYRKDKSHDFCSPIENDSNLDFLEDFIRGVHKILKRGGGFYCFCGWQKVDRFKVEIEKFFKIKNILIWDKGNCGAGDLYGSYGNRYEMCIFAAHKDARHFLNGSRDRDILRFPRVVKDQLHQNQKPVELISYLIEKSSKEGDVVFDCFMGSGSTGVACVNTDRNFIGIELDEKYFEIAKKRIEEATKEKSNNLF